MCRNRKTKAVFNEFFKLAKDEKRHLTPMQGIKLVYIAHGYNLGIYDEPLIDDNIEAWKYGAVVRSLYDELKLFGAGKITVPIFLARTHKQKLEILNSEKVEYTDRDVAKFDLSPRELTVIESIWNLYKGLDGGELSGIIHQKDTPWDKTWKRSPTGYAVISEEEIRTYYKSLFEQQLTKDGE